MQTNVYMKSLTSDTYICMSVYIYVYTVYTLLEWVKPVEMTQVGMASDTDYTQRFLESWTE